MVPLVSEKERRKERATIQQFRERERIYTISQPRVMGNLCCGGKSEPKDDNAEPRDRVLETYPSSRSVEQSQASMNTPAQSMEITSNQRVT